MLISVQINRMLGMCLLILSARSVVYMGIIQRGSVQVVGMRYVGVL